MKAAAWAGANSGEYERHGELEEAPAGPGAATEKSAGRRDERDQQIGGWIIAAPPPSARFMAQSSVLSTPPPLASGEQPWGVVQGGVATSLPHPRKLNFSGGKDEGNCRCKECHKSQILHRNTSDLQ